VSFWLNHHMCLDVRLQAYFDTPRHSYGDSCRLPEASRRLTRRPAQPPGYPLCIFIAVLYNWSMRNTNDFRTGRHCIFKLHVHLVFVTKYRRGVLTDAAHKTLRDIFAKVCHDFEAVLVDTDGEDDHVHLLVEYPPKVA